MKNTVFWLLLGSSIFYTGCRGLFHLIKVSRHVNIHFNIGVRTSFNLIDRYIVLKTGIEDKKCNFIFDSGAPSVIFSKAGSEWVEEFEKITELRKIKVADGKKIPNTVVSIPRANVGFFEANNWLLRKIPWDKECDVKDGIIGQDILDMYDKKFLVDFDDQKVEIIDEIPDNSSWLPLNSDISNGYTTVRIEIKGKEYRFKFDTGYSGSLIVDKFSIGQEGGVEVSLKSKRYGALFKTAGGTVEDTVSNYIVDHIQLNDHLSVTHAVLSECLSIKENLMGMEFIQNFNFILDYDHRKVWIQPRKKKYITTNHPIENLGFGVSMREGKLIISSLVLSGPAETAGFLINDEIISVNNFDLSVVDPCEKRLILESRIRSDRKFNFTLGRGGQNLKKTIKIF